MKTFKELDLIAPVQRALVEENYETPTPIQAQTIPAALSGHDILGCAQTGTGKTAAFALPILNQLGQHNRKSAPGRPFALVLAPTRELAIQIGDSFAAYSRHLRLRHVLVYGGVSQGNQVRALNRGAHIIVATPGRLLDLMNQGHIKLEQLEVFVLDEADRMLDMGFMPDLKRIISKLPDERQSLFFSATMAPKISELAQTLLKNPVSVNVTPESKSVKKIKQELMYVERNGKLPLLKKILSTPDVDRALVFMRTKRTANMLSQQLVRFGIKATAIHGNKSQGARQRALEAFRSKQVQVLVATDVAARGIDIDGITHVINFDLPLEPEAYVHRIGRTGRAGAEGIAISFCSDSERGELRAIEKQIGQKVPRSKDQPKLEPKDRRPAPESRTRKEKEKTGRRSGSKVFTQRTTRRSKRTVAGEDKPKQQGQKNTKWRRLKKPAKQTS
ncbi:MAG: DEAD/DEAH box helicase [Planctomycetes bacterium]|nr:DEAD/DEAH box helicase [Planctomycetota bacterium]MCH9726162.1 DEAD/DEAH box helicase [Planctomycetota bacterium]MCH9775668.1 DEAD/DEAH box helicase [Planctomycetota bacterium]MCH9792927.1 DEAD/DEAH box helicase [Planctomycetota bacterium]